MVSFFKSKQKEKATAVASEASTPMETPAEKDAASERLSNTSQEASPNEQEEDTTEYPSTWKQIVIAFALCLAVFCMALDNTIIATAIPRITDDFNSLGDVGWYASAYLLTTCAFQLLYGKIYTYASIKWTFIVCVLIFEVGSAICGAAPSSSALIVGRAIAGVGAGGLFAGGLLIIAHTVPLQKRPIYTGIIGGVYGIASVVGPLLGGAFTDSSLTWRWCFYINLPIGAVTLLFIVPFLKIPGNQVIEKFTMGDIWTKMDIPGVIVLLPCVVCLLLALQWGGSTYDWSDGRIIALFVVFGILAIAFGLIQIWKGEHATVPPRIASQRSVAGGSLFAFCLGASFFILVYWVPIWFQAILGVDATQSGIDSLPLILAVSVFSILSGGIVSATGYYNPWLILSAVCMATGAGALTTFKVDTGSPSWIGMQVLYGTGVGCGIQMPLMAVQTVLPLRDVPVGTSLVIFSQMLGGALFSSVAQNVFNNQLIKNLGTVLPNFPVYTVVNTGATVLRDAVPPQLLDKVLFAYNLALTQTWYAAVAMSALALIPALFVEWKSMKAKKTVAHDV